MWCGVMCCVVLCCGCAKRYLRCGGEGAFVEVGKDEDDELRREDGEERFFIGAQRLDNAPLLWCVVERTRVREDEQKTTRQRDV